MSLLTTLGMEGTVRRLCRARRRAQERQDCRVRGFFIGKLLARMHSNIEMIFAEKPCTMGVGIPFSAEAKSAVRGESAHPYAPFSPSSIQHLSRGRAADMTGCAARHPSHIPEFITEQSPLCHTAVE